MYAAVFHGQEIRTESIVLGTRPIKSGQAETYGWVGVRNITRVENQRVLGSRLVRSLSITHGRPPQTGREIPTRKMHVCVCVPCHDCENNNYTWYGNNDRPRVSVRRAIPRRVSGSLFVEKSSFGSDETRSCDRRDTRDVSDVKITNKHRRPVPCNHRGRNWNCFFSKCARITNL